MNNQSVAYRILFAATLALPPFLEIAAMCMGTPQNWHRSKSGCEAQDLERNEICKLIQGVVGLRAERTNYTAIHRDGRLDASGQG